MPFFRRKPFHLPVEPIARTPVPIVAEGAISSTTLGDGRLIPVLILDTSNRPDIDEFVRVHQHLPAGADSAARAAL